MKKFVLFLCALMFSSFVSAADIYNSEYNSEQTVTNKYKSIPKKDWEEYQKYKEEQENNVFISEEEYEEYKRYKEQLSREENKENTRIKKNNSLNSTNENKYVSNNLFIGLDKTLSYDMSIKVNDINVSAGDSNGWGITLELCHRENGIMLGAGINMNKVDSDTFTNIYPYIGFIFPVSDKNNEETHVDLFFGAAAGYGHCSEKGTVNNIEISCKGTLFWKLYFGININNLVFFANYSTNYIKFDAYSAYYGIDMSGNATYEKLSIGIGYRFIL